MRMEQTRLNRVFARSLALALLLGGAAVAHRAYSLVPVTVNGQQCIVARGTRVGECVGRYSAAHPGNMVSAGEHRVLDDGAGRPVVVLVNGRVAASDEPARPGDRIQAFSGTDVTEPTTVATVTVEPPVEVIGAGPHEVVVSPGAAGIAEVTRGAVSGEVIATQTVEPPSALVLRRSAAPAGTGVALTFDDGPWPGQTEAVLRILAARDVRATFFMLGSRVKVAPETARAVAAAGHAIGNHSYTHAYLGSAGPGRVRWEITATNALISQVTGVETHWFRAPGGIVSPTTAGVLAQESMRSALWTVDPQDWRGDMTAEAVADNVIKSARPGGIVVLHDGGGDQSVTIEALPLIIDGLRARGFTFVTLDELGSVKSAW
jgi:peptidoglycan/xylan/chitin deacetylase (PgdA/CDA1 family)